MFLSSLPRSLLERICHYIILWLYHLHSIMIIWTFTSTERNRNKHRKRSNVMQPNLNRGLETKEDEKNVRSLLLFLSQFQFYFLFMCPHSLFFLCLLEVSHFLTPQFILLKTKRHVIYLQVVCIYYGIRKRADEIKEKKSKKEKIEMTHERSTWSDNKIANLSYVFKFPQPEEGADTQSI